MGTVKVAGIQMACGEDRERNLAKAAALGRMAAERGARVICFQQLPANDWFPRERDERHRALAEGEDGPTLAALRPLAAEFGATLVCPLFERAADGACYNTAMVVGPEGGLLGRYRKVHVPTLPLWEESFYFQPGDGGFPVFESQGLRFGVQICWDNFFPEGTRHLALAGAELVFAPNAAAFATTRRWETVLAANAIVNNLYVFRVNRVGHEQRLDFYGRSVCIDPEGEFVLPPSGMHDGAVLVDVDPGAVRAVREEWSFLRDRRPDVYGG
ncbi:MAG TPA: nitrilase-related carbon-nitrogen hydrolase [bacterium]